jgi:hypothetical protein
MNSSSTCSGEVGQIDAEGVLDVDQRHRAANAATTSGLRQDFRLSPRKTEHLESMLWKKIGDYIIQNGAFYDVN